MRLLIPLIALVACQHTSTVTNDDVGRAIASADAGTAHALVDAGAAARCMATYSCGLSHPGLGSSSNTTSIDFSTCTKVVTSESGPYEQQRVAPGAADPTKRTRSETKLPASACASLVALVTAITDDDVKKEQEPAQMDSTACTLTVTCPADAGARTIGVQRQTLATTGRCAALIRALQAAH